MSESKPTTATMLAILDTKLDGIIALVGERLNKQDGKIETIDGRTDGLETRVGTLEVAVKVAAIVGAVILTILGAYASHILG